MSKTPGMLNPMTMSEDELRKKLAAQGAAQGWTQLESDDDADE